MTGKSLVQRYEPEISASATSNYASCYTAYASGVGGSYSRALDPEPPEETVPTRSTRYDEAQQLANMRSPFPRARKAAPPNSNIDVTPSSSSSSSSSSSATPRTLGVRFLRPSSHKAATDKLTASSESSVSRSSALSSLTRFRGNQSNVSTRYDESYSRAAASKDDDAPVIKPSTGGGTTTHSSLGPSVSNVRTQGECLPRLHSGSSGNNLLAQATASSSSSSTSLSTTSSSSSLSKTSVTLPATTGYSSDATTTSTNKSSRPRGLVGLQNLGNTCFMNSCLQCVSNIPALVKYFQSGEYVDEITASSPTKGALASAFGELVKALWTSPEFTSTRPVELKRVIGKVASRFTGYDQQDAQEFLRFLLDGLHEDLNRITTKPAYYEIKDHENAKDRDISNEYWKFYGDRNKSAISDLFCGQLRSEIKCHTCNHRSLCFDVFWDLSVPVPHKKKPQKSSMRISSVFSSSSSSSSSASSSNDHGEAATSPSSGVTIQDCLKAYTDQELLDESDSYYCAKCKTHREVTKKISLYRLPQVLVVHLKRFSYSTFSRDKVNTAIKTPFTGLDIGDFCAQDAVLDGSTLYDLTGVVHHVGSLNGGHYTAECVNADTNDWYDFNDSSVSLIKKPQFSSSSAYILFFRRRAEKTLTI